MKTRFYLACGAAAPLFYLGGLALGTFSTPGYNPFHQAVSELIAAGSAWRPVIDVLFTFCGLLVLSFSLGLHRIVRGGENRLACLAGRMGSSTLSGISLLGLVILAFPMDPPGSGLHSLVGLVHTVSSCLMCAVSLPAVLCLTCWLYANPGNGALARFSMFSGAALFVTGSAAAGVYFLNLPFLGLLERLTFFAFFQWLTVVSLQLKPSPRVEMNAGKSGMVFPMPIRREKPTWTL